MAAVHKTILGSAFIRALLDAGVVPDNCTKVIIEADVNNVVKIHYSALGQNNLLEVVPPLAEQPVFREYITNDDGTRVEITSVS